MEEQKPRLRRFNRPCSHQALLRPDHRAERIQESPKPRINSRIKNPMGRPVLVRSAAPSSIKGNPGREGEEEEEEEEAEGERW